MLGFSPRTTEDARTRLAAPRSEVELVAGELHDETQLTLAEERLDVAYDASAASDRDPVADLQWVLAAEVAGGDHFVAAAKLVQLIRNRRVAPPRPPRYAPDRISRVGQLRSLDGGK